MNKDTFELCTEAIIQHCMTGLIKKNIEYARDTDALSNFKRAGARLGCSPEEALIGMETKHSTSIVDMIHDLRYNQHHPMPVWKEKIGDSINYLILLYALLEERNGK